MSIQVKNITKTFGAQKAVDAVSFEVKPGEITGFLGPNGAGKTTMMRILTCFMPQTSGEAYVCGMDVTKESVGIRKQVGYLPENNPLYPDMYVKEYLSFIGGVHKVPQLSKRVEEVINRVGLQSEKKKKIGALSKGYRQRVGLAQTLIHGPEVLILDEPTSGLDPNQISEIRDLIKETGKAKTVFLSTHIMQEVEAICSRIIIIHKGKIVADSPASDLGSLTNRSVVTVEFDKPIAEKELHKINNAIAVKYLSGNTWQITSVSDNDIRNDIFQFAVRNHLTVLTIHREKASLEDIFREVTKGVKKDTGMLGNS